MGAASSSGPGSASGERSAVQSGSLRTVLELVLILRDEGDADALVSRLLQNHKPEERHRLLLAEGRAGTCFLWMDLGEFDLGEVLGKGGKLEHS